MLATLARYLRIGFLSWAGVALGMTAPVAAELPLVGELESSVREFGRSLEDGRVFTSEYLEKNKIREGPCEGRYYLPPGRYLVGEDARKQFETMAAALNRLLALVKPITDLEQEVRVRRETAELLQRQIQRNSEVVKETNERVAAAKDAAAKESAALAAAKQRAEDALMFIKQGQREAVRDWLLQEYARSEKARPPSRIEEGSLRVVIVDVLFGTFVSQFPRNVRPGEDVKVAVTFRPATFLQGVFRADVEVGPAEQYSRTPPAGLMLEPATVQGERGLGSFQPGQRERVTSDRELVWTWGGKVAKDFQGGEFDIVMEAGLTSVRAAGEGKVVGRLPVEIKRTQEPGWWEWLGNWLGETIGVVVGYVLGLGTPFVRGWAERRRQKKASRIIRP